MPCDISDLLIGIVSLGLGILMICIGCRRGFLGGMRMERRELAKKCARIEKAGGSVRDYLSEQGYISPWGTWFRLQKEELGRQKYQITDGKGQSEMRKITLADKKKAVEIALEGGNPLAFLKEVGSGNPNAAWYYIKKTLKETDPDTYEKLIGTEAEEKPAEPEIMPVDSQGKPVTPEVVLTIKSEDLSRVLDETPHASSVTKPVNYGGFDVMALRDPITGDSFVYDEKHGRMDWRSIDGDEVTMEPDEWRKLIATIPKVMEIFGI